MGAIVYNDLSQNPQSDVIFDWDKMLAMEGNTAPYLLYALARCRSLLRKAEDFEPGGLVLEHESERALALLISRTPEVLLQCASTWKTNALADHLYQLAGALAAFWRDCPVYKDGVTPEQRQSRLTLAHATSVAMSTGLRLLGLTPLERM